ncbi:uncharacterized protein LOC126832932 [Adelges cooleyi]|uniref:uncharacterized protein LOC126832932 n=1 Tax=Adelges cooleyi TaxID=133065 RepID=UPI00218078D4|nr:uncharacterized protein LOC126832932 [Adelges cooleyi]
MRRTTSVVLLLAAAFAVPSRAAFIRTGGIELPTYTDPCKRNDKNFSGCLKNTLQYLIPKFSKEGIPQLNISSLDPYYMDEYLMHFDSEQLEGKCLFKNVYNHGLGSIKIVDVRALVEDPRRLELEIDFELPRVISTGKFKGEGKIGQIPIMGKGVFNVSSYDVAGSWILKGDTVELNGQRHMRIKDVGMKLSIGDMKIYATNLINGSPELSQMALTFVNQFWRVIFQVMLPYAEEAFEKISRPVINQVFLEVPYDQLFPPSRK